ncbi:DUF6545 domain-containing protein, partial [Streptomyces sp. NPDC127574]
RRWLGAYALIIAVQLALFAVGDAAVERRTDFDTYYASTPFLREMIVVYLVAHSAAAITTTVLCWGWTRHTRGWINRALKILAIGWINTALYGPLKLTAVIARWAGHNLDALSTNLAPLLVGFGALLVTTGYILPLLGPPFDSMLVLLRLRPLVRLLVTPYNRRQFTVTLSWTSFANVELHLTKRTAAIRDSLSGLIPHLDSDVRRVAFDRAVADGESTAAAEVIGSAAMIAVAARSASQVTPNRNRSLLDAYQADLLVLARAVRSPAVRAVLRAQTTNRQSHTSTNATPPGHGRSDSRPPR